MTAAEAAHQAARLLAHAEDPPKSFPGVIRKLMQAEARLIQRDARRVVAAARKGERRANLIVAERYELATAR